MIIGPVKRTIFALFNHKQELGLLINMELHTLDDLYEDFEIGRWKVRKFVLPNASDYLWDIENITWAQTGLIDAWEANRFFDEASQMIANSIFLFQKGFFDTAFYSLRQSIEISLGTLYLTANPEKMKEWEKLEPGFVFITIEQPKLIRNIRV